MKYNTAANSLYEVFNTENPKYVRLAMMTLKKNLRLIDIITKRFGPNFDGVGGERLHSYAENDQLRRSLSRVETYIQTIKVLSEVYKETDEKILNRFYEYNDEQITNMMHKLLKNNTNTTVTLLPSKNAILSHFKISEEILERALEHVKNFDHKRIYMYYYGIGRRKMNMNEILKIFPAYTEVSVKKVLLEVQTELIKYVQIEKGNKDYKIGNRLLATHNTSNKTGFMYNSYFDYFFTEDDTLDTKCEKCEIILDYMEIADEEEVQFLKKIFGEKFNQLDLSISISKKEKGRFNYFKGKTKRYLNRILSIRQDNKGKIFDTDRVILTLDNGFKEKLNDYFEKKSCPLAMDILIHYLDSHEDVKKYFSKFYDLDTMDLKTNVYSSKNDAKTLRAKVKEINDYIKTCTSISKTFRERLVNYFKKSYMSDARVQLVFDLALKGIETLSDNERVLLQKLYGEDYKVLNIYADITSEDVENIKKSIEKIGNYVSHSLEMINTYRSNIFMYFHKSGMSATYRTKLDIEISKFIDDSSSKGKYVAVMLYGATYSKLNPSVNLSKEQVRLFNCLLNEINEHIKSVESSLKKKKTVVIKASSFLDYFTDSNASDEENKIIIEEVKKVIDNDNSKYKTILLKFYDENYDLNTTLEMTNKDKEIIRYYRKQIFIQVFGNKLPESIYDMAINGRTNENRKKKIIEETDKFIKCIDERVKVILRKVYGSDFHSFNSEANLTNYELYIINRFNLDLNDYIIKVVPFVRAKKPESDGYVKTKNGRLPKKFFSFLNEIKTDMTLEELTKDAKNFVNKSKSKNVLAAKKLYGEELLELDESIIPTEEEVTSVRFLIRNIRTKYKGQKTSLKDVPTVLKLPENVLDNFNVNYNETNKNNIINRINYNISARDSAFSRILHENYGENLTKIKGAELQITANDLALFKASVKVVNNQFSKDMIVYNYKDDLLEYFYTDTSNREELINRLAERIDALAGYHGLQFKRLIKFMYDDNYKLIKPILLKDREVVSFENTIKYLRKSSNKKPKSRDNNSNKYINPIFFDNFLFEGEEVVPESRKNTIIKIVRGSKASAAKLALDLFGINLDQKCKDLELLDANKYNMKALIKMITNRLTNSYGRGLFMLADNFIDQFYLETDTPEIKEAIRKYLINYLSSSQSQFLSIVESAYDENYILKKEYKFDGDKRSYYSFVYSIKLAVNKYRYKLINGTSKRVKTKRKMKSTKFEQTKPTKAEQIKPTKVEQAKPIKVEQVKPTKVEQTTPNKVIKSIKFDMMDLGPNGYLALTNDLFDIELIGNEEIQPIEFELIDDVIINAYNELMDSQTIMDLLMISSDTLVNFYLNHIDDLEDPTEAFNYLINLGDKDIIKKLMEAITTLSDEIISKITKVNIDSIREYEIMTKDDKVNTLNEFILKRK